MSHVQALSGGIGKLDQRVEFGLVRVVARMENACFLPFFLPFLFNWFLIVFQGGPS